MNGVLTGPPNVHVQHDRHPPRHHCNIGRAPQHSSPQRPRPRQLQTRATWVAPSPRAAVSC